MSPSVSVRLLLTQSDARLVELARGGHERAFEALVARYRRPLLGYCRRLLLSNERAEDAVQQGLLQAWVALRAGVEVREVKPWLYRVVHNAALNMLRLSGYDYATLSETLRGSGAPAEDLERRIAVREALAGLATLPAMQREALLHTAVHGSSYQQTASMLGLSEGAVRGLVHRARATLRAAATALTPSPLLNWALSSGGGGAALTDHATEVGAGGTIGLAGALIKAGVTAITAGVLAGGLGALHLHPHPSSRHPHLKVREGASREPRSEEGHSGAPTIRTEGSEISLAALHTEAARPGVLAATRTGQGSHPRTGSRRRMAAHRRSALPHRLVPRAPTLAPPTGASTPLRIPSPPPHPPAAQNPAPAVPPPKQYPKPAGPATTQQTGRGPAGSGDRHDLGGDGSQSNQTSGGGTAGSDAGAPDGSHSDSGSAEGANSGATPPRPAAAVSPRTAAQPPPTAEAHRTTETPQAPKARPDRAVGGGVFSARAILS